MVDLLKAFGRGILYILCFPFFLVALAIFAVIGLLAFIFQLIKSIFYFFTGQKFFPELPEDKELRLMKEAEEAKNNPQPQPQPQINNQGQGGLLYEETYDEDDFLEEPTPETPLPRQQTTIEEVVFEEEPAPVQPVEKKKPNKAVFAVIIPIVAVALVAAIAIPVTIHFVNANNNIEINDDDGNNNNNGGNNGGKKASFNITSTTRYEETSTDRIDGYQFEPNKDYIEYRFILSDAGWYVEWIDYGKWSFDASIGYVSAVCTTYETFNVNSQWTTNTYPEGASNAQKSLKVINDTTLYWNGNSNFVAKKVNSFTHPIVIFQERP